MSDSLQPHKVQNARLPCPSLSPRVCSNSCQWLNYTIQNISFSVVLFSSPIRLFSNELVLCIRWLKYWSFSFSISPSNEYLGLISFRIDWFDLVAVQGTLNSFLNTTAQKHQLFGAQSSLWSNSLIHTWLLEKSQLCQKWCLCFLICCLGLS